MGLHHYIVLFIISIFFFIIGCRNELKNHGPPLVPVTVNGTVFNYIEHVGDGRLTLFFPSQTSKLEKELLIDASKRQLEAFEKDWGGHTTPTKVFIFDLKHIPCGNRNGHFGGCYLLDSGHIHITMDMYYAAWALYHELVHRNIENHDVNHTDARWDSLWRPMQSKIWAEIAADHRIILGI